MPLLLTPAQPFTTAQGIDVASAYAIIRKVGYVLDERLIRFEVGYYYNEQAYADKCAALQVVALPLGFVQEATPEQANGVPIFQFLEQVLTAQLTPLLGEGATIQNVPWAAAAFFLFLLAVAATYWLACHLPPAFWPA